MDVLEALAPRFRDALAKAFGEEHAGADPLLRRSDRADFQANVAMGLAKKIKKNPQEVAKELVAALDASDILEKVEVAGPGFLNLTIKDDFLAKAAMEVLADERLGVPLSSAPETVVIDYSHPNVAKEMHVGHLRSTVIGDALARILTFRGHAVVRHNHLGDWGTPFGMLIEHLIDLGEAEAEKEVSVGELSAFYKAARKKFDESEAFQDRSRKRVTLLQGGDERTLALWKLLVDLSAKYFQTVYDKLEVTLRPADIKGESFYNPYLAPLCEELEKSGAAVIDDGALCLFPPGFKNKEGDPLPLIARKKDGGFGSATTDLAAIRYRLDEVKATRLLYVVGAPQAQHLAMIFAAAKELGWLKPPARAEHAAFGSVLGTDKKVFRARAGDSVRLVDLIDAAIDKALEVVRETARELTPEEQTIVAHMVGIGSIKFADLSSDRIKDYVFDLERMVSFTGATAGYCQYAHARSSSIFKKGGTTLEAAALGKITFSEVPEQRTAERRLVMALLAFPPLIAQIETTSAPHPLAGYAYDLAATYTTFYDACPVIKAEGALRTSRLALCALTARTLHRALDLLGIRAPERM